MFKEDFFNQLDQFTSSPILFLGSGFSLRYLQTENWENLLKMFAEEMQIPFEKYKSKANGNWPRVGSLISEEYHNYWFNHSKLKESSKEEMISQDSPLKVAISSYFIKASKNDIPSHLFKEIELLKSAKINGIITTNYDLLAESIFPEFHVFKSQKELIFSTLQEVGEIYKIHGCCTEPNSIILTEEDYIKYAEQNAYIAAKLLTIFLEHPTIFIGYSISDENIRNILKSVIKCLDKDQINEIAKRLFFIEYNRDITDEPLIDRSEIEIGDNRIPLTRIKANSYEQIYEVLTQLNQKIPASLLRKIKEHIYELVVTNDPGEKLAVVDFNNDTDLDKVDVVIGIGINGNNKEEKSYATYGRFDLAEDLLKNENTFDPNELCAKTLPTLCRAKSWIPVWKYLIQIKNQEEVSPKILNAAWRDFDDWKKGNTYSYQEKQINETYKSINEILVSNSSEKALHVITCLNIDSINIEELEKFLTENKNLLYNNKYTSTYMKLLCLFDRLKYGN
ncbi:MAG: SIR2 family protein [Pelobium sp.]